MAELRSPLEWLQPELNSDHSCVLTTVFMRLEQDYEMTNVGIARTHGTECTACMNRQPGHEGTTPSTATRDRVYSRPKKTV